MWKILASITWLKFLITIASLLFIKWIWGRRKLYILSMSLPGPVSLPFIGSIFFIINVLRKDTMTVLLENYDKYKGTYGFWLGIDYHIVALEPDDLKIVFSKSMIAKPPQTIGNWALSMGSGLLTMSAVDEELAKYKGHRKLLTPAFNTKMNKKHYLSVQFNCVHLQNVLESFCSAEVDIAIFIQRYTADVISEAMFETELKFRDGNRDDFFKAVEIMCKSIYERIIKCWYRSHLIYDNSALGKNQKRATETLRKAAQEIYDIKKKQYDPILPNFAIDKMIMQILLESESEGKISEYECVNEIMNIWNGGSDTSASLLIQFFMIMATHKQHQDRAFNEIKEFYKNDPNATIKIEDLDNFTYLEMCLKETLRLLSPAPISSRYVTEDIRFKNKKYDVIVPPGTCFVVTSFCTGRLSSNWEQPNQFIPERYSKDKAKNYEPFSSIPFSGGPRKCPGASIAKIMVKAGMAHALLKCEFISDWNFSDIPLSYDIAIRSKWGYKMKINKRKWL